MQSGIKIRPLGASILLSLAWEFGLCGPPFASRHTKGLTDIGDSRVAIWHILFYLLHRVFLYRLAFSQLLTKK